MSTETAETGMEARIARLEADVSNIRGNIEDVKFDVRALRDKIDDLSLATTARIDGVNGALTAKIDGVNASLAAKIENVNASLAAKIDGVKDAVGSAKVWALVLYIALASAQFGTMARAFGWL